MPNYARTGGILTIIAGAWSVFYMLIALMYIVLFQYISQAPEITSKSKLPPEFMLIITIFAVTFAVIFALVGALAIAGGVFALKRKHWAWSLAGAIAGAFLLFPVGIAGTIMVSMGRQEFTAAETPATVISGPATPVA